MGYDSMQPNQINLLWRSMSPAQASFWFCGQPLLLIDSVIRLSNSLICPTSVIFSARKFPTIWVLPCQFLCNVYPMCLVNSVCLSSCVCFPTLLFCYDQCMHGLYMIHQYQGTSNNLLYAWWYKVQGMYYVCLITYLYLFFLRPYPVTDT